jgi:peptidoglycan hydrolase CwlO-like protein
MNWLPAVKALLPYVGQIVTAAMPVFSKKSATFNTIEDAEKQIAELQDAVIKNAESIKLLANQVQELIHVIDSSSLKIKQEMLIIKWLSIAAIGISLATIIFWLSTNAR